MLNTPSSARLQVSALHHDVKYPTSLDSPGLKLLYDSAVGCPACPRPSCHGRSGRLVLPGPAHLNEMVASRSCWLACGTAFILHWRVPSVSPASSSDAGERLTCNVPSLSLPTGSLHFPPAPNLVTKHASVSAKAAYFSNTAACIVW